MENQTTANQIDFNYCKAYNAERIQKVKECIKERFGETMCGFGIGLCEFPNPYEELKNVLAQHYSHYLDMAVSRAKESELQKQIRDLTAERNRLNAELDELRQTASTNEHKSEYPEPLRELLDYDDAPGWCKSMGIILDDIIFMLGGGTDFDVSSSLYYVRSLQKFFSDLSDIEQ